MFVFIDFDNLNAALDLVFTECIVCAVGNRNGFAVVLNAERVGLCINQVASGSFGFLYGIFAVSDISKCQLAFRISYQCFNDFTGFVIQCKLCAFQRFFCFAVFLGQLHAALDRIFTKCSVFLLITNDDNLSVGSDVQRIGFGINEIACRCLCFLDMVAAVSNLRKSQFTVLVSRKCLNRCACCIVQRKLCAL